MSTFDPSTPQSAAKTLYEEVFAGSLPQPGRPVLTLNKQGEALLTLTPDGQSLYFFLAGGDPLGRSAVPGDDAIGGGEEKVLWRSPNHVYADPVALLSDSRLLVRQESDTMSPNYFIGTFPQPAGDSEARMQVTHLPNPYADIKLPTKQLLKYKRADGVELDGDAWLPAGYDRSQGPLPTLMEAYPAEFKTRAAAGQVRDRRTAFRGLGGALPCSSRRPDTRCWRMPPFRSSAKAVSSQTTRIRSSL